METNLKFSDIIRYILLGSLSLIILSQPVYILLTIVNNEFILEQAKNLFKELLPQLMGSNSTYASVAIVVLLAASYLAGAAVQGYRLYLLQTIRTCYQYTIVRNLMEYCFGNSDKRHKWLNHLPHLCRNVLRLLIVPNFYYDVYNYTRVLKFRKKSTLQIPDWIYISDEPQMTCEVIDKLVGKRGEDDHLYLNEFLTSLTTVIWTSMMMMIPLLIFMPDRTFLTLAIYFALEIGFCITAKSFGEEYIRSLGMWFRAKLEGEHRMEEYGRIIALHGAPKVYLLVRTISVEPFYLNKTLESIERQSYKNFQVIVIEDLKPNSEDSPTKVSSSVVTKAQKVVEEYNDREKHPSLYNHITFCKLECGGPATAMMHERNFFLKMTDKRDISVILDDDDELRTDDALLNIVHAITRNKANLCLSSFESKGDLGLDITNNGGGVHNHLIRLYSRESISKFDPKLCYASSIGWTKACTAEVIEKYMRLLNKHEQKHPGESYCSFKKYEDFPDFIMLLFKGTVITGVHEATHNYHKRLGRITTAPAKRDFSFCRAKNLNLLIELVGDNGDEFPNAKEAMKHTLEFVLFKTCQIEDIYHKSEHDSHVFTFTDMLFEALSNQSRKAFEVNSREEFRKKIYDTMQKLEGNNKTNSRIFRPTHINLAQMEDALHNP